MPNNPHAELIQFNEQLHALSESLRGRMAQVMSSEGYMVRVLIPSADEDGEPSWDGPLGPYPSTVSDLLAGKSGVLLPLRGGQMLFIPIGS